jgi:hypothetical protein
MDEDEVAAQAGIFGPLAFELAFARFASVLGLVLWGGSGSAGLVAAYSPLVSFG